MNAAKQPAKPRPPAVKPWLKKNIENIERKMGTVSKPAIAPPARQTAVKDERKTAPRAETGVRCDVVDMTSRNVDSIRKAISDADIKTKKEGREIHEAAKKLVAEYAAMGADTYEPARTKLAAAYQLYQQSETPPDEKRTLLDFLACMEELMKQDRADNQHKHALDVRLQTTTKRKEKLQSDALESIANVNLITRSFDMSKQPFFLSAKNLNPEMSQVIPESQIMIINMQGDAAGEDSKPMVRNTRFDFKQKDITDTQAVSALIKTKGMGAMSAEMFSLVNERYIACANKLEMRVNECRAASEEASKIQIEVSEFVRVHVQELNRNANFQQTHRIYIETGLTQMAI